MSAQADSLVTGNVFLDTCIFVAENYTSTPYRTLIRLATIGAIQLKITDITLEEIRQQISEKIDDAVKSLLAQASKRAILTSWVPQTACVIDWSRVTVGNSERNSSNHQFVGSDPR